ncbi:hypothetical protein DFH07DRAFT_955518 [Mycena maculata]|uniref:Uncharacterized protein n=1 Tax=Mycena maculata TaxID=230809 RepID=A0AAD7JJ00_9AGAR|nr:hypothetical protein DFH07DRAFT_955518 [Mycena maculata]
MSTQTNRTYSEFFSSGLRAMAGTSYRRPYSGSSSPIIPANALKSSGRYNMLRNFARRARTSSSPTSFTPSENSMTSTRQQRRSSIVDLPSRLIWRMTRSPDSSDKNNDRTRQSYDGSYFDRDSTSYEKMTSIIDPFDASPNSSSFFIDFVEPPIPVAKPPPQRPQSFLILGEPTKTQSYLRFPLRRERPSSIQSMPLPSQSRRSSFQYCPPSRDKYDRSWALEEEEESPSPTWIEDVDEMHDPAANIDWRQFHVDLLHHD